MNVQVLVDSVVRQVTVLIAQLATAGGVRAPLAQIANQVFLQLARELDTQGVSRKVSADMFGMALRAYVRKVRRLDEAETQPGVTLWHAVLESSEPAASSPASACWSVSPARTSCSCRASCTISFIAASCSSPRWTRRRCTGVPRLQ